MSVEQMPMNGPEQQFVPDATEAQEAELDFGDFDLNAAFQNALSDVVTDQELALEEKVMRMEAIIAEGTSEVYRDFVDMQAMAAQIEMICNHDHALKDTLSGSESISDFLNDYADDGHDHEHGSRHEDDEDDDEDDEKGTKKKKRKKKRGWLK